MGCSSGKSTPVQTAKNKVTDEPKKKKEDEVDIHREDIRDKYELGKILGSGSFGQVREAKLKPVTDESEIRAVKMIERDSGDGEWSNQAIFVREVHLLQQIKHENIIRYFDFYEDPDFLYVVMELCTGGEVFAKIVELKRFSEKHAAYIGKQMLAAMDYIHKLHIAHRDIKAENFMLSEPSITSNVKMIDFGMACKFKPDEVLTELCGSPHYLAPELIGQKYNHLADVWAFGILLYLIMYGHYPYDAKHPRDIMVKILTEPIAWQTKVKLSKDAIDFLKQLLEHSPKKRLTAEASLGHKWMKLADQCLETHTPGTDAGLLSSEAVRSAHKKVTATRKVIDPKVDQMRNEKLKKIEEDFRKGIRRGQRLGATPQEEFMSKPEFVRRENKITTAPSRDLNSRRESLTNYVKNAFNRSGEKKTTKERKELETIEDGPEEEPPAPKEDRKPVRSMSLQTPRRLSYIGNISKVEESKLASLYEEKRSAKQQLLDSATMAGVVPSAKTASSLPGTSEEPDLEDHPEEQEHAKVIS